MLNYIDYYFDKYVICRLQNISETLGNKYYKIVMF